MSLLSSKSYRVGRSSTGLGLFVCRQIVEELNLPPVKIHCSVLAEDAIKSAIEDYRRKQAAKKAAAE